MRSSGSTTSPCPDAMPRITVGHEGATIEDLGSKNGTYVGGKKIRGAVALADRDSVKIGPAPMTLRILKRTGSTRSTRSREPKASRR